MWLFRVTRRRLVPQARRAYRPRFIAFELRVPNSRAKQVRQILQRVAAARSTPSALPFARQRVQIKVQVLAFSRVDLLVANARLALSLIQARILVCHPGSVPIPRRAILTPWNNVKPSVAPLSATLAMVVRCVPVMFVKLLDCLPWVPLSALDSLKEASVVALEAKALRIIHHGGGTEVAVAVDIMDPATTLAITMVDIMVAVVTTVMAVVVVTTDMDTLITSKTHTIWLPCPRQNNMIKSETMQKKSSEYIRIR